MNIWMISGGGTVPLPNHGWFFDQALAQEKCDKLNADMPANPYYEVMPVSLGTESTPGVWVLTYVDRDDDNYNRYTNKDEYGWFSTEAQAQAVADAKNANNRSTYEHWTCSEIDGQQGDR